MKLVTTSNEWLVPAPARSLPLSSQPSSQRGRPMIEFKRYLDTMEFAKFMPEGKIHHFLDRIGGHVGDAHRRFRHPSHPDGPLPRHVPLRVARTDLSRISTSRPLLKLRITQDDDKGMSLPVERRYRLLVHTSDVSRRVLARLPWDYNRYGKDRDDMAIIDAVRASMSIPFFFEPFEFEAADAVINVPMPGAERRHSTSVAAHVPGSMAGCCRTSRSPPSTESMARHHAGRPSGSNSTASNRPPLDDGLCTHVGSGGRLCRDHDERMGRERHRVGYGGPDDLH